tara:strand:+ start:311 stop:1111 length:801 start_codon:yes stop_codon:yes gene_type:complete
MVMSLRRIRKKTSKLVDELIALRDSRKSIDDFCFSYFVNFYDSCHLMHSFVKSGGMNKELLAIAYRQYYVFLVSCWETFFRDIFVYVHTQDESLTDRLLVKLKPAIDAFNDDDISLPELLSKSFNFQNINDLDEAFSELWGANFLKYVCTTNVGACGLNGKISDDFFVNNLFCDWHEDIVKTFTIRHKVVHDANFRPEVDFSFIQRAEALFLVIPQIATQVIAERFNLGRIVFQKGELCVPYIFTVSEILSNDWQVNNANWCKETD